MPRAGGVYSAPPGTTATPNTTVASAPYNALVADLVADANNARPVSAGGTGATNSYGANDALNNQGADIASAATTNLAAATGVYVNITGTVTITGLGTLGAGIERETTFTGMLTLTHNATSLILPGAANIITAAGDSARWRSLGSGNWKCMEYTRAATAPFNNVLTQPALTLEQSTTPTPTAEGRVQWDTDDNVLAIGDGAATQLFVPIPAATAAGDTEYFTAPKVKARLAKGTGGQRKTMNDAATAPQWSDNIASSAVVPTNTGATSYDITGIPAWVKRITLMFMGTGINGSEMGVQVGSSGGGIVTTGYSGSAAYVASSTNTGAGFGSSSFRVFAGGPLEGAMEIRRAGITGNVWVATTLTAQNQVSGAVATYLGASRIDMGANALDRIRLTTLSGTNTFNNGNIAVFWE